jgi:3-deoxy-D-manno-octulosonic-acid transferase
MIVADAFVRLRGVHAASRLIICPRHGERAGVVLRMLHAKGLSAVLLSEFLPDSSAQVLVVDRMGYLAALYAVSSAVFVGGSLVPHGGQNILEPAYFSKPICTGPHMFNFKDIMDDFIRHRAVVVVNDGDELYNTFLVFLNNINEASRLGEAAHALTVSGDAILSRTMDVVKKALAL